MSIKSFFLRGIKYAISGIPNNIVNVNITYTLPSEKLKGKNIIITGGNRGLGYAMAKRCAMEGANVIITGRNEEKLQQAASTLNCKYLVLDVQDFDSFDKFFIESERIFEGPVDCLVNNAGISLHEKSFLDVTIESFDAQIDTNLKGSFFMAQKYVECYKKHNLKNGKILFISSETSVTVDERPYGLTKAAINSLVQGLAFRYIKDGIRINAVAPGVTSSDMTGFKSEGNLFINNHTTCRVFLPEEVAELVCFMLSDASNSLNGQILVCNEGNTINARWK